MIVAAALLLPLCCAERGIGLTEEERASAAEALAAEEEARMAVPVAEKERLAQLEVEKLQKAPPTRPRKVPVRDKPKRPPPAAGADDGAARRAIGISESERRQHAEALEREEAARFAEPQSSKEERARRELEKLNRKLRRKPKPPSARRCALSLGARPPPPLPTCPPAGRGTTTGRAAVPSSRRRGRSRGGSPGGGSSSALLICSAPAAPPFRRPPAAAWRRRTPGGRDAAALGIPAAAQRPVPRQQCREGRATAARGM